MLGPGVTVRVRRRLRWGARRAARMLRQQLAPSALILMYHRVIDLPSDPQLLAVSPQHFAEHLEVLRRLTRPLQLEQLARTVHDRDLPNGAVVVTFDDGYADNLLNARPLLERYNIPATVFVTAEHVGIGREFWWDDLDRLLLQPGPRPATVDLNIAGTIHHWSLNGATQYDDEAFKEHRRWHVERPYDPTARQRVYRSVYEQLHGLSAAQRDAAMEQLRGWAGVSPAGRPSHRTLTVDELVALGASAIVDIGSHTLSHPFLAGAPATVQRWEIQRSRAVLEDVLGRPVRAFAYPFGAGSAETAALVREAGYRYACASHPDVVWNQADLFRLPRVVVRDSDGDSFARMLRYWLPVR